MAQLKALERLYYIRLLCAGLNIFAVLMLGGALVGQYVFDLYPCSLCIYQRYPYIITLVLTAISFWVATQIPRFSEVLIALCLMALFAGALVALYHAGVEHGLLPGPDSCTNDPTQMMTLEEMRRQIRTATLVSCDQAMGYIMGISLAEWNAILSLLASFIGFHTYRKAFLRPAKKRKVIAS